MICLALSAGIEEAYAAMLLEFAAVRIQANFRGHMQHQKYTRRVSWVDSRLHCQTVSSRKFQAQSLTKCILQRKAAVKIQRWWIKVFKRKRVEEAAASSIQGAWRSHRNRCVYRTYRDLLCSVRWAAFIPRALFCSYSDFPCAAFLTGLVW